MDAILKMKDKVDTLIVVANDQLLQIVPENTPLTDAFLAADDILRQVVVRLPSVDCSLIMSYVPDAATRCLDGNTVWLLTFTFPLSLAHFVLVFRCGGHQRDHH
jgi:hypothetical protein